MITIHVGGSTKNTETFLRKLRRMDFIMRELEAGGKMGVVALAAATPLESGLASGSWSYEVRRSATTFSIIWSNSDIENGFPVAIMLQYGYTTGTGGYVQGKDYINPAMRPVFDQIAKNVWKAVTSS